MRYVDIDVDEIGEPKSIYRAREISHDELNMPCQRFAGRRFLKHPEMVVYMITISHFGGTPGMDDGVTVCGLNCMHTGNRWSNHVPRGAKLGDVVRCSSGGSFLIMDRRPQTYESEMGRCDYTLYLIASIVGGAVKYARLCQNNTHLAGWFEDMADGSLFESPQYAAGITYMIAERVPGLPMFVVPAGVKSATLIPVKFGAEIKCGGLAAHDVEIDLTIAGGGGEDG